MLTVLRRLFWLGLLGGAGYAGWSAWQGRRAPTPAAAPEWPPMPTSAPTTTTGTTAFVSSDAGDDAGAGDVTSPGAAADPAASDSTRWVLPADDGSCPDGFPIKANDNSGIYHVPGGRFYDRTVPERCYAEAADAEADGYRAAKA